MRELLKNIFQKWDNPFGRKKVKITFPYVYKNITKTPIEIKCYGQGYGQGGAFVYVSLYYKYPEGSISTKHSFSIEHPELIFGIGGELIGGDLTIDEIGGKIKYLEINGDVVLK